MHFGIGREIKQKEFSQKKLHCCYFDKELGSSHRPESNAFFLKCDVSYYFNGIPIKHNTIFKRCIIMTSEIKIKKSIKNNKRYFNILTSGF